MTASLDAVTTADPERWSALLPARCSAFGSLEFARITEEHTGARARLLVFTDGETVITYPSFLRRISNLPIAADTDIDGWDMASPEYTGPLARPLAPRETARRFQEAFAAYCRRERIVAEFAHLHPWYRAEDLVPATDRVPDRDLVYVDLRPAPEVLWQESYSHACRKNILRARAENVRVVEASTPADIEEFHRIYTATMARRAAAARYSFPLSYFMAFFRGMRDYATFLLARYQERVVAGTLFLHDDLDMYSYLGGADQGVQHVRPSNAVVDEAIRWGRGSGKQRLILGGGHRPGDGIFRFKSSFSPHRARFEICRRIHMRDEYGALCRRWSSHHRRTVDTGGFFPAYRAVPPADDGRRDPEEATAVPASRSDDG